MVFLGICCGSLAAQHCRKETPGSRSQGRTKPPCLSGKFRPTLLGLVLPQPPHQPRGRIVHRRRRQPKPLRRHPCESVRPQDVPAVIRRVVRPLPALRLHEVRDSRFGIGPQQLTPGDPTQAMRAYRPARGETPRAGPARQR